MTGKTIPNSILRTILTVSIAVGLLLQTSCQRKAVVNRRRVTVAPTASKTSPFDMAMDFLNNLDQYQPDVARIQILDKLRDWSREEEASVDWIADPMFSRLPRDLREKYSTKDLARKSFELFDVLELRQGVWLRDVSKTVAAQPLVEPHIQQWIDQAVSDGSITKDDADDLSLAYRLFDWVVRNVQLDNEVDPIDFEGGQETIDKREPTTIRHQLYPWQNLLYGHGDFEERSRLFMLLCRQVGINAVMLIADRGDDQLRQPWCCGVLLGHELTASASPSDETPAGEPKVKQPELYLFDAKLGVPLPGQGGAPFSKLTDYVAHPELLEPFTVGSNRYRIVPSDLGRLVASIDATPAALSQRMRQIEGRLRGDKKIALTVKPTPLSRQLRKCKHITNVEIWPFPYRGYQFIERFNTDPQLALERYPELYQQTQMDQRPFTTRGPIMRGRLLQLRGFDRGDYDTPGAKKLFMQSRMSKQELARFNLRIQDLPKESPLVAGLPEDKVQAQAIFDARVQAGRRMAIRTKDIATYWLGTISMNNQEYKVASDFLQLTVADEASRFLQSGKYNLARAYEAIGLRDKDSEMINAAIELYEGDGESPQHPGNLLRAKRLRESL